MMVNEHLWRPLRPFFWRWHSGGGPLRFPWYCWWKKSGDHHLLPPEPYQKLEYFCFLNWWVFPFHTPKIVIFGRKSQKLLGKPTHHFRERFTPISSGWVSLPDSWTLNRTKPKRLVHQRKCLLPLPRLQRLLERWTSGSCCCRHSRWGHHGPSKGVAVGWFLWWKHRRPLAVGFLKQEMGVS